jgi:hypothetical protein
MFASQGPSTVKFNAPLPAPRVSIIKSAGLLTVPCDKPGP